MTRIDVDDVDDARVGAFMGLRDHDLRRARELPGGDMAGFFMAEGDLVIDRALRAGHRLQAILIDGRRTAALPASVAADVPVLAATPDVLIAVCGRPRLRDPIACFVRPAPSTFADVVDGSRTLTVLEGVTNPTNVGVIARDAAGLGVDALVVDARSCDPLYRRAVRVSMGEVFALRHARVDGVGAALEHMHREGVVTVALTPASDATDLAELKLPADARVAVVLGAEGPGLSAATMAACRHRVCIPMARGIDSINVGSAAAVAFYAIRAQRLG